MTTELEKQFFDTFGIEPHKTLLREYDSNGVICSYYVEYPPITDRILLELIDILMKYYDLNFWTANKHFCMDLLHKNTSSILYRTCGTLKDCVLEVLRFIEYKELKNNEVVKQQVRVLF